MIFTLKSNTSPSWRIGQEIRLHFIHTPRFGGIIVFPPVGLVAGLKVSVRFWEVHICWHAGNLSQISVINIYIYIGTPRPSSSSSSSPSSSVGRSIFPLTSWLCYILLLNVTQKKKMNLPQQMERKMDLHATQNCYVDLPFPTPHH